MFKAKDAIEASKGETKFDILETRLIPQDTVELTAEEDVTLFKRLLTLLDDVDDVQNVYHNVNNL